MHEHFLPYGSVRELQRGELANGGCDDAVMGVPAQQLANWQGCNRAARLTQRSGLEKGQLQALTHLCLLQNNGRRPHTMLLIDPLFWPSRASTSSNIIRQQSRQLRPWFFALSASLVDCQTNKMSEDGMVNACASSSKRHTFLLPDVRSHECHVHYLHHLVLSHNLRWRACLRVAEYYIVVVDRIDH